MACCCTCSRCGPTRSRQQSPQRLSGPTFVNASTRHHTPAALMLFLMEIGAALLPFTTETTNDAAICPFGLLSLMVRGFASHRSWVGITMPSFSASITSRIFYRPSVSFPMYLTSGTAWIFSLSQDSFFSMLVTPLSTMRAAVMMTSRYISGIAAVAFWWVTAVIVPLAYLFVFIIRTWAGAFCWKSARLIADAISWSIFSGGGTLSSLLNISRLSAVFNPAGGAGPGPGPGPTRAL